MAYKINAGLNQTFSAIYNAEFRHIDNSTVGNPEKGNNRQRQKGKLQKRRLKFATGELNRIVYPAQSQRQIFKLHIRHYSTYRQWNYVGQLAIARNGKASAGRN